MGGSSSQEGNGRPSRDATDTFERARPPPKPRSKPPELPFHQRYVLMGKIGKGAFASVYLTRLAHAGPEGEKIVVKVIDLQVVREGRPIPGEVNARIRRAAEKEIAVLKRVRGQERCIQLVESVLEDTLAYIVMERCELTLLHMLERLPQLREAALVRVFQEMCQAICGIHRMQVVHRDIKPDNFLCTGPNASIRLCDFGLAEAEPRAPGPGGVPPALTGVYGTAPFMSPEMLSGNGYNRKTDVWSLGVIIYVITLGQFPYIPAKSSANAMKAAILLGSPPPSFRPKANLDLTDSSPISPNLKDLVRNFLCREPQTRPDVEGMLFHDWFSPTAERASVPLRPMLYSAKRVGAFDIQGGHAEDPIDRQLKALQARYHYDAREDKDKDKELTPGMAAKVTVGEDCAFPASAASSAATRMPDNSTIQLGESHDSTPKGTTQKSSETTNAATSCERSLSPALAEK